MLPKKLHIFSLVLLVLLLSQIEIQAAGNNYYVATNGNDSSSGTIKSPWRTINKASQTLQAGDTVFIRGGTYNERIVPVRSGSSGNKITYKNYQNEVPVVRGEASVQTIVDIGGKNHVVIDGLKIQHQNTAGWKERYFLVVISGSQNEFKNNEIIREGDPAQLTATGMKERGVVIRGDNTLVENNYIRGVNIGVLVGRDTSYTTIRGNTITETGQSPIDFSGGGNGHNLVENNILERSAVEDGIQFEWDYDLVNTHITDQSTVIRNNVIRYNAENAIDLKGAGNVVIENNIIYGTIGSNDGPIDSEGWNRGSLFTIMKGANAQTKDVIIRNNILYDNAAGMMLYDGFRAYNNTVVGNNRDYTGPNSSFVWDRKPAFWGIQHSNGKIAVQNNIVAGHTIVEVAMRSSVGSEYINNNLYYNANGVYFTDFKTNYDWERVSFSDWKTYLGGKSRVTGNDASSMVADPRFVNAPEAPVGNHDQYDFHLQSNSPGIDAGGPLTLTKGGGSGRILIADDAKYFFDGYGIVEGDLVKVGSNSPVRVTDVNIATNTLTLASSISWKDNDWMTLPYEGSAPDIGAYEFGGTATTPPFATPTSLPSPPSNTSTPGPTSFPGLNLLVNPSFEDGSGGWVKFSNGDMVFSVESGGTDGSSSAKLVINQEGGNVQLYQKDLTLEPDTKYFLSFDAKSNSGHDLSVHVHEHDEDFTNYGLKDFVTDLSTNWQTFSTEFTTSGFGTAVNDARLRFWLAPYDEVGDEYFVDNVILKRSSSTIPGDTDGDGDVDIFDYNTLVSDFGQTNSPADFNGDGVVDIFDYNILVSNFGIGV